MQKKFTVYFVKIHIYFTKIVTIFLNMYLNKIKLICFFYNLKEYFNTNFLFDVHYCPQNVCTFLSTKIA